MFKPSVIVHTALLAAPAALMGFAGRPVTAYADPYVPYVRIVGADVGGTIAAFYSCGPGLSTPVCPAAEPGGAWTYSLSSGVPMPDIDWSFTATTTFLAIYTVTFVMPLPGTSSYSMFANTAGATVTDGLTISNVSVSGRIQPSDPMNPSSGAGLSGSFDAGSDPRNCLPLGSLIVAQDIIQPDSMSVILSITLSGPGTATFIGSFFLMSPIPEPAGLAVLALPAAALLLAGQRSRAARI